MARTGLVSRAAALVPDGLRRAWRGHKEDVVLYAAGLAFYALVSTAPLAIVSMWIASLVAGDSKVEQLASALSGVMPEGLGIDKAIARVAKLGTSLGLSAVVAALWPATAYGAGLRRAFVRLNAKNEKAEGFRGRGLVLVLLLPVFVLGTLLGALAMTGIFGEGFARALGWAFALVVAFAAAVSAVVVIYRVFPVEPLSGRGLWRASATAAGGIAVSSLIFAVAIGLGGNFKDHYAISGVAAIVLFGLWLFASNALLLAAYVVERNGRPSRR